jgi:hypothetical protein
LSGRIELTEFTNPHSEHLRERVAFADREQWNIPFTYGIGSDLDLACLG